MAITIVLFLIGVKSYPMFGDRYEPSPQQWLEIWDQWDFGYYQKIAEFGYSCTDDSTAFYPLVPWLLRLVDYFSKSFLADGLVVSGIACDVAARLVCRLVTRAYPAIDATR